MKIYTKVGDGGQTALFGGQKTVKNAPRVKAYGSVDELCSVLGWARAQTSQAALHKAIDALQKDLFVLGADLATPLRHPGETAAPRVHSSQIEHLEKEIDRLQEDLSPLKTFILPGGSPAGAALHWARTVCRRAEREVVELMDKDQVHVDCQIYLNRLSDYLFVLARTANRLDKQPETPWIPES